MYRGAVGQACEAFEGREVSALQVLQARMELAAERLRFELAARLRDSLRSIRAVWRLTSRIRTWGAGRCPCHHSHDQYITANSGGSKTVNIRAVDVFVGGDIIVAINGQSLRDMDALIGYLVVFGHL